MTNFGPYTSIRRLGVGGMGEVWIARRISLGGAEKLVAIKTLLPEKARDPNARRMFLDEARLSMLMSNSNIVQVFDAEETSDGTCYMAMELVKGIDLAKLTEQLQASGESLSHSVVAYIIGEILRALIYAHDLDHEGTRRTIVHRDISPHNVMLSVSGEVKLMDFGIARLASEETSGMFVRGKIRYMPPEQLEGESREPTIDLFAVGAILHELLDGKRFRSVTIEETRLIGMCARGEVPPLTCPPNSVPVEFERLRKGLLEPLVKDRIPTARAAHHLLSQWPGNRDAKFELEELLLRFVDSASAPSGVSATSNPAEPLLEPTEILPSESKSGTALLEVVKPNSEPTEVLPHDGSDTDVARRWVSEETTGGKSGAERSVTAAVRAAGPAPANNSRVLAALLACLGLMFAFGSVGTLLGWWTEDEPTTADFEVPESSKPQPEPQSEPVPSPASTDTDLAPTVISPPNPAPKPPVIESSKKPSEIEGEKTIAIALSPEPPKQVTQKTQVTISAAGVWWQVKIAGKEYTYDRLNGVKVAPAKIKPGDYTVSFRADPEVNWQPVGKVTIPEIGPVKLDIKAGMATVGK